MRRSSLLLTILGAQILLFILLFFHASYEERKKAPSLALKGRMVAELALTDLCLFTEASYTRHPTQADMHTPFQEHPICLEHFPSGSIVTPPALVRRTSVQVD